MSAYPTKKKTTDMRYGLAIFAAIVLCALLFPHEDSAIRPPRVSARACVQSPPTPASVPGPPTLASVPGPPTLASVPGEVFNKFMSDSPGVFGPDYGDMGDDLLR